MSFIAEYGFVLLVLACAFGFFMAWGVGANDVANAMGTSVGSRALTIKQAIIVAMIFEFCGAYLAGGEVTETIKNGIVDAEVISPDLMVLGMMSALLAAGTWLLIATMKGWPVSTTHSIIGAVIGFAGARVIEQTIREKLPEGFQRAEYLLDHGMLDRVTKRTEMRDELITITRMLMGLTPAVRGDLPAPEEVEVAEAAAAVQASADLPVETPKKK
jgi:hypothetical protein